VSEHTLVKVMTDGILLAEVQRDRMLRRYDTVIIDEAHERSLNIDFLIGYLHQLLPKRPDLKVIITSATIDTQRFSAHFDAPVIEVSGRTYPVEMRYRPLDRDTDQVQGVLDAVDELAREGEGDVLVFLSGEREIHDTADALRRHGEQTGSRTDVLPLYARLSAVEQHRIFQPHRGRRVVLSTNVAETSLTVPGVRYVVDAGTARISRYSHRLKVQRLPIEPVSQASANQRAGRCGRVAPGVCIRLYDEDDFDAREAFTEPEILRTNLASVILQMTALGLGDVDAFPFLDPPDPRSVRDGYALLEELGAIEPADSNGARRLTPLGKRLARLPVDPRLGRMVLEAERHGCAREVMVIAAALSIQDVRERPAEHRQAADELHRRFEVPGSDFLTLVKLWDHLREQQQALSSSQFRKLCRSEYLNYLRVREWADLFSQLRQVAGQIGIRTASRNEGVTAGHPDRVHQALLAGLLSHLGMRDSTEGAKAREYRGAYGSKFAIGHGSAMAKSAPRWVVAAELVETNRLWGRVVAGIQPEWAEQLGAHLVKRSYGEPTWDARRGAAVCREQVSLYGLPIVTRTIGYDRVDAPGAREMFIRCALVEGEWTTHQRFWAHNTAFLEELAGMGERSRRVELIDTAAVFEFYDRRVGPEVVSTRHFDRWWREARRATPDLLTMRVDDFLAAGGFSPTDFPGTWHQEPYTFDLTYRFDPSAADDGVTVHVPLAVLHQISDDGFDWQVPGFRPDLVGALLRSLPKEHRRELVPMAEVIERVTCALRRSDWHDDVPIGEALADIVHETTGVHVPMQAFEPSKVPTHLRLHFAVDDDKGKVLAVGDDLPGLRTLLATRVRAAVARETAIEERKGITTWDFDDLPRMVETSRDGMVVRGYPALLDDVDSVSIRVLTNPDLQARVQRTGVRRLLTLAVPVSKRAVERDLTNAAKLAVARDGTVSLETLEGECITAAADDVLARHGGPTWTADGFDALSRAARDELADRAATGLKAATEVCAAANEVRARLDRLVAPAVLASADDARAQLARLVHPGFVVTAGLARLTDLVRYVKAIDHRLAKLPEDPHRDQARLRDVVALEQRYVRLLQRTPRADVTAELVELGWSLEELRVSVFAQGLGAARGVSAPKIAKQLAAFGG
jgi:ATP-dependent helicase HrpA